MRDITLVKEVQELYRLGFSVAKISETVQKNSSSVSRWCRKISNTINSDFPKTHQERERTSWYNLDKLTIENLDVNFCRTILSMLYWCEGAKYPSSNTVSFVSSDEQMQKVFILLMRKSFPNFDETKFNVMLQLHTTHNIEETIQYWSCLLGIPTNQFYKPHITTKKGNKYRSIYTGTCGLRYHDYRILLRIMGGYNQIAKQIITNINKLEGSHSGLV